ncbi:hypothetical protein ACIRBY_02250 [Streptomyces sp. NPDC096136]|uniref:hypothetical protein n=1 Tax=Streptomyces sp. NPDC096136 TaxID=3366076 RepID=UPI0038091739
MFQHDSTRRTAARRAGLVAALGLGLALTAACGGGDGPSGSSSSSKGRSGSWQVGDCGGPDPKQAPDGYRPLGCDEAGATFKALEIAPAGILPGSVRCPAGTDLMIRVSVSYGSSAKDGSKGGGIPTHTVCGRNLSGDHPGDAGAGGGQLVKGDCVSSSAQEVACASAGRDAFTVLDLVEEKGQCPAGTTEPMELTLSIGRPYDVICTAPV